MVAPDHQLIAAEVGVAAALAGLSSAWFFVGCGRPIAILIADATPRLLLTAVSAVLIVATGRVEYYAIAVAIGYVLAFFLSFALIHKGVPRGTDFARAPGIIRDQMVVTGGRAISPVYTTLPIAIIGLVSPASVAVFSAVERLMRMGLNVLTSVPHRLQIWLGSAVPTDIPKRIRVTIALNAGLGIVSGLCFFLLFAPFAEVLFSGTISAPPEVVIAASTVVALICTSRGAGLALVALRSQNLISAAVTSAAITGGVAMFALGAKFGALGGFLGEAIAEATGLLVQLVIVFRLLKKVHRTRRDDAMGQACS